MPHFAGLRGLSWSSLCVYTCLRLSSTSNGCFCLHKKHTQLDQLLQYKGNSSWQHCKQSRFKNNHPQRVDSTHREIAFLFTNRAIYCFHYHKRMNTRERTPFWHSEVKACPKRCLQAPPVVSHPVSHKDTLQYGQKVREAPEQG